MDDMERIHNDLTFINGELIDLNEYLSDIQLELKGQKMELKVQNLLKMYELEILAYSDLKNQLNRLGYGYLFAIEDYY